MYKPLQHFHYRIHDFFVLLLTGRILYNITISIYTVINTAVYFFTIGKLYLLCFCTEIIIQKGLMLQWITTETFYIHDK